MTNRLLCVQALSIAVIAATSAMAAAQRQANGQWITAWGTSQYGSGMTPVTNTTVRMIARVTIPGDSVRLRFDNTYGTDAVAIGKVTVGWRKNGASLAAGSNRPVSFKGSPNVSIPPGGSVESDPVSLKVTAQQDLAVSFYIPGTATPSQHTASLTTSYLAADGAGDLSAEENAKPFATTTAAAMWLKSIDVLSSSARGGVVAFGDSITQGSCATRDGYDRWTDWLALRLDLAGQPMAIVNEGIGGNTILSQHPEKIPPTGTPGLERLDRDVLTHKGITHVVLFMGTNDMRRTASAAEVQTGMEEIVKRVKARGLRIIGGTAIPCHNNPNPPWDPSKTKARNELNAWIRTKAPFDAVIDFDAVMKDPSNADLLHPPLDCDGIHPNALGYYAMGHALRLDLFTRSGRNR
jgi:lysophospholipase L1-like esterase